MLPPAVLARKSKADHQVYRPSGTGDQPYGHCCIVLEVTEGHRCPQRAAHYSGESPAVNTLFALLLPADRPFLCWPNLVRPECPKHPIYPGKNNDIGIRSPFDGGAVLNPLSGGLRAVLKDHMDICALILPWSRASPTLRTRPCIRLTA